MTQSIKTAGQKYKPFLAEFDARGRTAPIWLMRQAGRYLPEYRELRGKSPSFMDFCFNPKAAAEATLQPIRRFGFDAAILFSDILVIPEIMGQPVTFETGEGPRMQPLETPADLSRLSAAPAVAKLAPVFETIERVRAALPDETTLIGFCGAPWTVATYMIAGRGTPDQRPSRLFAYRWETEFRKLIDLLTRASIEYLSAQITSGVEAVQIFDSWVGVLPEAEFEKWSVQPVLEISREIRKRHPDVKIIVFPRAVGSLAGRFSSEDSIDAIGIDTSADLGWSANVLQAGKVVQGNLDPLVLLTGGRALEEQVANILQKLGNKRHIFNLGHGILPETPVEHVEKLLKLVRQWERPS
ncbi:MAG: uroporphyrinogen decarboxylase [Alphaproteobacteria bacterium]|nr:uroporphyrinogen decarboxylase [Alphaproteobacteria bacterium]